MHAAKMAEEPDVPWKNTDRQLVILCPVCREPISEQVRFSGSRIFRRGTVHRKKNPNLTETNIFFDGEKSTYEIFRESNMINNLARQDN